MKEQFFYRQSALVEWLEDFREELGLDQKNLRPYVSEWVRDDPVLPYGAKQVLDVVGTMATRDPWIFCEPPAEVEDLVPKAWWYDALGLEELGIGKSTWNAAGTRKLPEARRAQVQERLEAYRVRLRGACTKQAWDATLATAFEMEDFPLWWGYSEIQPGAWALLKYPDEGCRHFITAYKSLWEVVSTMPPDKAVQVAARARALSRVEITLLDPLACALTYEVEITDQDRAWAEQWYRPRHDDAHLGPEPFLGDRHVNVLHHWATVTVHDDGVHPKEHRLHYRTKAELKWDGRLYKSGPSRIVAVERDGEWVEPTQEDLDFIDLGVVWGLEDDLSKEELWPVWRDNQLTEGFKGFEKVRPMRDGEETLLRARFEKHWSEHVQPSYEARRRAKEADVAKKREEFEEAQKLAADAKRRASLLPPTISDKDRRVVIDLVSRLKD